MEATTDNYAAENVLGKAYEKAGDDAHALFLYRASVATEPRFPQSQFNLAVRQFEFGETDKALQHLQAAAKLVPGDPDIQFVLGIDFAQHSSWTNAAICFSNAITVRPDFAAAEYHFGNALSNLGRSAESATHYRKALHLNPDLADAKKELAELLTKHPELK